MQISVRYAHMIFGSMYVQWQSTTTIATLDIGIGSIADGLIIYSVDIRKSSIFPIGFLAQRPEKKNEEKTFVRSEMMSSSRYPLFLMRSLRLCLCVWNIVVDRTHSMQSIVAHIGKYRIYCSALLYRCSVSGAAVTSSMSIKWFQMPPNWLKYKKEFVY